MSNTNNQLATFLDSIGRTIIGEVVNQTPDTLTVKNPALVAVQANPQTNQLQLQILPLFFKEFLANQTEATTWTYKKANITESNPVEFNPQFVLQYGQLFGNVPPPAPAGEVVKLFDEE
ncbi:MAG: hypothetical protein RL709_664 [Pseudomonadota bacterium]|jgi:hypothetical protein